MTVTAPTLETYVPRLKQRYDAEIRAQLKEELELPSVMQVPRVTKVTLNMGVGEAKTDAKALDAAIGAYRWHRRIAGDARRKNAFLQFLYKGG